jgi:hypothetical protein
VHLLIEVAQSDVRDSNEICRLALAQIGILHSDERPTKVSWELNPLELNMWRDVLERALGSLISTMSM